MHPKAYIETSVISYLTARPSRDQIAAAHQRLTRDWWDRRRARFDIYVSEVVVQETGRGDAIAARDRLESISRFPVLRINAEDRVWRIASSVVPSFRRKPQPMRCTLRLPRQTV